MTDQTLFAAIRPAAASLAVTGLPHRLALVLAVATFPLLWVGGLVTTYKAGMAVPDWPNTYGYNLLLYPWQTWVFGPWDLFIEHGHRLLGALVGVVAIALVVATWWSTPRGASWRWLALAALLGVCLQGGLGGLRVLMDRVPLARLHGCVGPLFFAYAASLAVLTSPRWHATFAFSARQPAAGDSAKAALLVRQSLLTALFAYGQLVLGAHLRHLPPGMSHVAFRVALAAHLFLAVIVAVHAALVWRTVRLVAVDFSPLRRWAWLLVSLVGVQLLLGVSTWIVKYNWPAWLPQRAWSQNFTVSAESPLQALVVTAHVAVGSLILSAATILMLWSWRLAQACSAGASGVNSAPEAQDRGVTQLRQQWLEAAL